MSDKYFAKAMSQIAAENELAQRRELDAQRRQHLIARVRNISLSVVGAGLLAAGYYYRAPLQQIAEEKFLSKPKVGKIEGSTGEELKGIQASAEKRDAVLNEITK